MELRFLNSITKSEKEMSRSQEGPDGFRPSGDGAQVSRRGFLKGAGVTAATFGAAGPAGPLAAAAAVSRADEVTILGLEPAEITLTINGIDRRVAVEPSTTLLDCLRDRLDTTGSKRVCNRGFCGACSVIIDGRTVNSCSYLAVDAVGKSITTIEGIEGADGKLAPIQEAFIACDATQCGFCTPGMIVACHNLLAHEPKPTRDQVKEGISGNICRCGTYQNIFEAVEMVVSKGGAK